MWIPYALAAVGVTVIAVAGSLLTDVGPWYRELNKPSWNPPDWAFPVVWSTVFLLLIISLGQAWNHGTPAERQVLLWITGFNFILNVGWSLFFFALRKPRWALVEVVVFWLSIVAMVWHFASFHPLSAWLLAPYLVWVSIASLLNLRIVQLNPEGDAQAASG